VSFVLVTESWCITQRCIAVSIRGVDVRAVCDEQINIEIRSALFGLQRTPQPGKATADNEQLALLLARERREWQRALALVQPERSVPRVGKSQEVGLAHSCRVRI
jgi:hypothetical protein